MKKLLWKPETSGNAFSAVFNLIFKVLTFSKKWFKIYSAFTKGSHLMISPNTLRWKKTGETIELSLKHLNIKESFSDLICMCMLNILFNIYFFTNLLKVDWDLQRDKINKE